MQLRTLSLLVAVALAAPAAAQYQHYTWHLEKLRWPLDPGGQGFFGGTVLADLDADGMDDFVTIRGGVVEAICGPAVYVARMTDIATGTDVTCMRGKNETPDRLIVTGPSGVERLEWNPTTLSWNSELLSGLQDWKNARRIRVRDTGYEEPPQIIGVTGDGMKVRALVWSSGAYVDTPVYDSPVEIIELEIFDREGNGQSELVVIAEEHMAMFDVATRNPQTGIETWVSNESYDFGESFQLVDVGVGSDACSSAEWIAWISTGPSDFQWLATISGSGPSAPVNLQGDRKIVGFATGDWNLDCDTDLLVSWRETQQVPILENRGSAAPAPFSILAADNAVEYADVGDPDPYLAAVDNHSVPVTGDLDGDGDPDVCFPVQSDEVLYVGLNDAIAHDELKPRLEDPAFAQGGPAQVPIAPTPVAADVRLRERFDGATHIGEDLLFTLHIDYEDVPAGATHVETYLWRMPYDTRETDPVAIDWELYDLDGSPATIAVELQCGDDDTAPQMGPVYYWMHRYVTSPDGDEVTATFPAQVHGIQAYDPETSEQWDWMTRPELMGYGMFLVGRDGTSAPFQAVVPETLGRGLAFPCLPALPDNQPPSRP